jgi:predicted nucleotidyltransferase
MRLTATQRQCILQATRQSFGADAKVWLFGSRADDTRRGGDIDLYVETNQANTLLSALRCKIAIEEGLDLHVDLLVNEHTKNKPIYQIARKHGVLL